MPKDYAALPPRTRPGLEEVTPLVREVPAQPASPAEVAPPETKQEAPKRGGLVRRLLLGAVAVAAIGAAAWWGHGYWTVGRFQVSTDDAYVQADFTALAPKFTGYVATVPAVENAHVKAGDPLVVLEDGDYRNALQLAEAQLASQQASVERISRQAEAADAGIAEAEARVDAAQAGVTQTQADLARYTKLAATDVASAQKLEAASAANATAIAALKEAEAGVATARADREVIAAQKTEAQAVIPGLAAARERAQRDLDATVLRAPFDGVVGNLSVAVGDFVSAGKRLLAVVPLGDVYIDANFKETQVENLAPGTHVIVSVDAFPGRSFGASVEGIAPASGSVFSLLPPENATGNFTKVVQRLPVRVAVPDDVAAQGWLRPGLSVTVSADTRTTPQN